ncbi:MAG: hypothetical protein CVU54_06830 [Deltaproteobacteria bacterium HGW-Deltaproteobacteria-12]|jgi:hypothetical protein|nr:MAG: hypothetical protein CVU54_06830 [Deltaproteobacteria bacterium HGW-Deltaproteobacteria-12]
MLKKYQPERTDLLINTDWGIPHHDLATPEAQSRRMLLFQGRWVTKEEKKQLKDEQSAYISIRIIGYLLLFICIPVLINIRSIAEGGITHVALAVLYALAASVAGSGLIRCARFARYPAILIFLSFFILPFLPLFESEKGSPLMFILGFTGLYYLLRRTARRIFWPETGLKPVRYRKFPSVRYVIYGIALLIGLVVGYVIYDLSRAGRMAAGACRLATPGIPVEELLFKFPEADYKIIRGAEYALIVPKRGMGRNSCMITHDGRTISSAKTGFAD